MVMVYVIPFSPWRDEGLPQVSHLSLTDREAAPSTAFAFTTEAKLVRKHRPTWEARFLHRYELEPDGSGSVVTYTCEVYPLNYRPYWLHPLMRPATGVMVPRAMRKNLENLARMAEKVQVEAYE
jgi:hypothetical protein